MDNEVQRITNAARFQALYKIYCALYDARLRGGLPLYVMVDADQLAALHTAEQAHFLARMDQCCARLFLRHLACALRDAGLCQALALHRPECALFVQALAADEEAAVARPVRLPIKAVVCDLASLALCVPLYARALRAFLALRSVLET